MLVCQSFSSLFWPHIVIFLLWCTLWNVISYVFIHILFDLSELILTFKLNLFRQRIPQTWIWVAFDSSGSRRSTSTCDYQVRWLINDCLGGKHLNHYTEQCDWTCIQKILHSLPSISKMYCWFLQFILSFITKEMNGYFHNIAN